MHKLIEKWKINKGLLAKKMNMPLGTFCNKLSPKHTSTFSEEETIQLKLVLKEMRDNISNEIEIDFNDALSMLVTKPVKTLTERYSEKIIIPSTTPDDRQEINP